MVIQEPVQAAIWHALNHYAYSDAVFLAERLYAEVGSDESLFLLSTCYYRSGKPVKAYMLLQNKGCPNAQCKYLMAQCCMEINKLSEAESVLAGNILSHGKSYEDIINEFGDASSYVFKLLAKLYSKTERGAKAAEHYKKSLKLNPFQWSSFEALCHIGEKPDPTRIFHPSTSATQSFTSLCQSSPCTPQVTVCQPPGPVISQDSTPVSNIAETQNTPVSMAMPPQIITDNLDTSITTPEMSYVLLPPSAPVLERSKKQLPVSSSASRPARTALGGPDTLSPLTPSFGVLPLEATPSPGNPQNNFCTPFPTIVSSLFTAPQQELIKAPNKKPMTRRSQQQLTLPTSKPVFSQSGNTRDMQTPSPQPGLQSNMAPGVRRSSRLFSNASSSVKENNKNQNQNTKKFASPKAPAKKSKTRSSKLAQELNELNKADMNSENKPSTLASTHAQVVSWQKQSVEGLMALLQEMGKAYVAQCHYDCHKALALFNNLPPHHYKTGWVLCQVGKAHFEMAEYQKAEKAFSEARQIEPYHMEGLEIYSTSLWHLQKEVQLSALAQELTDMDSDSPQAWCVAGNCFSLQKEHDTAIKFFQRAIQVDPDFAYAYTLLGHEYVFTEELDKAMSCFRSAVRVDPRHYNAWYGIGMIYYKQEKLALAEVHFRKALSINSQSSVLMCHIGVVQHALKKSDSALATFNRAIASDPKNPLCKFHRASVLFATDKHKEALQELEELKEIVPKESLVYFLIGKVHKKLGNTHLALMNFSWAMDLDPKGANNQIKEAIDKRYVTDEEDPTAGMDDTNSLEDLGEGLSNNSSMSLMEGDDVQLQAIESDESL